MTDEKTQDAQRRADKATDAAVGGASRAERAALEIARRMDPALDAALSTLQEALAPIAAAAAPIAPPADLFERVEAALAQHDASRAVDESVFDGDWRSLSDGIEIKPLWNAATFLIRCAPGAVLPSHPHLAAEHTVVVLGDMVVGATVYGPGDRHSMPAGVDHQAITTRRGCLLLVAYEN